MHVKFGNDSETSVIWVQANALESSFFLVLQFSTNYVNAVPTHFFMWHPEQQPSMPQKYRTTMQNFS